jgi:predicted transcriptional regulator
MLEQPEIIALSNIDSLLEMTSDIVTAMVTNNSVPADQLPALITSVYGALAGLGDEGQVAVEAEKPTPAVTARRSQADPNVLISMIDGKPYSSLKRHVTRHGYTPESYREAFGLKSDYPMVAPGYSERRRELAKKIGLGRKSETEAEVQPAPTPAPAPAPAEPAAPKKARKPRAAKAERKDAAE